MAVHLRIGTYDCSWRRPKGPAAKLAATALGHCMIERHLTLDRAMWASEKSASAEPQGIGRLFKGIRVVETARGDGVKRVLPGEVPIIQKLRRIGL